MRTETSLVYFMMIDNASSGARRACDRLELHVRKLKHRGNIWKYACEAIVDTPGSPKPRCRHDDAGR